MTEENMVCENCKDLEEQIEVLEEEAYRLRRAVDVELVEFIDAKLMAYVDRTVDIGLFGSTRVEILQYMIRSWIIDAMGSGLLETLKFPDNGKKD